MMTIADIDTLEDLRLFYLQESKKIKSYDDKYLDSILENFELSSEEKIYITQFIFSMEEQSNKRTLINSKEAQKILLKRNDK